MCERAHCPTVSIYNEQKKRCFVSPGAGAKTDRRIRNFDCTWQGCLELGIGDVVLYKAAWAAHAPPPSQIHGWRQDSPWPSTQVAELNGAEARSTRRLRLKHEV